jgi:beta-galactosidase
MNRSTTIVLFLLMTAFLMTIPFKGIRAQAPDRNPSEGAGDRVRFTIDDGWKYISEGKAYAADPKRDDIEGENVSLPHTWNAKDPFDNDHTYRRSVGWYRRPLVLDGRFRNKRVFLCFEGAGQLADVYVNGAFAGRHKGGYTAFTMDITDLLKWKGDSSSNLVAVQVSNAWDPFIPPLSIGYASYGGIYRDVWVIATGGLHFTDVNTNASGVFIKTPAVSAEKATVDARSTVKNEGDHVLSFRFVNIIYDAAGHRVDSTVNSYTIAAQGEALVQAETGPISHPRLWSPDDPYLYRVVSRLEVDGRTVDEVSNPLGFRWFSFDPDKGFSLNGKKLVLHGTTRHQDLMGKGDALSGEDHERDMKMIKAMGSNFIRLAHYPQAPAVLDWADKLGIIIWEEVPVVNYMTLDPEFLHNAQNMIREMIRQGYDHPSVALWGSMNEILLYGKEGSRVIRHTDTAYIRGLRKYAVRLDSTVRAEDPTRYSTMAMHLSDDYARFGLDKISQVVGHNIYDGWYSGKLEDFGKDLDAMHRADPRQIIFVSEYGAEGEIQLNTEKPGRMDYTGQYQRAYHESYLRQIDDRPWLAGTSIWNEFDFSQPNIGGPTPHRNQKGMVTWDRKPKDVYYLYKANWNPDPMVYIATRNWLIRAGERDAPSTIDVYSNRAEVTLYVNGQAQKTIKPDAVKKASWQVYLKEGPNTIMAMAKQEGKTWHDETTIDYRVYDAHPAEAAVPFQSLSVNTGSNAQYLDPSGEVWIEDRPYTRSGFGSIGGVRQTFARGEIIKGTGDVPLYYTYLDSLKGYRFDVKDGEYAVTLYFAEGRYSGAGERVFDIAANGRTVLRDLDLAGSYGYAVAIKKTFIVRAVNGEGVDISFDVKKGSAVLSGIKIQHL